MQREGLVKNRYEERNMALRPSVAPTLAKHFPWTAFVGDVSNIFRTTFLCSPRSFGLGGSSGNGISDATWAGLPRRDEHGGR